MGGEEMKEKMTRLKRVIMLHYILTGGSIEDLLFLLKRL